jgi:hypothetical protein
MARYVAGERAADGLGTGLVVIPEPEACLREERQAAIAATFAPEERCASEESDEGYLVLVLFKRGRW